MKESPSQLGKSSFPPSSEGRRWDLPWIGDISAPPARLGCPAAALSASPSGGQRHVPSHAPERPRAQPGRGPGPGPGPSAAGKQRGRRRIPRPLAARRPRPGPALRLPPVRSRARGCSAPQGLGSGSCNLQPAPGRPSWGWALLRPGIRCGLIVTVSDLTGFDRGF